MLIPGVIPRCMLLLIAVILYTGRLYAQSQPGIFNSSRIDNYKYGSGLPHSQITHLGFDAAGYLWAGTMDGLARFDGQHFRSEFGKVLNNGPVTQLFSNTPDTLYALRNKTIFKIVNGNIIDGDRYSVKRYGTVISNLQTASFMFSYMSDKEYEDFWKKEKWLYPWYGCFAVAKGRDTLGIVAEDGLKIYIKGRRVSTVLFSDSINYNTRENIQLFSEGAAMINRRTGMLDLYMMSGEIRHLQLPAKAAACKLYRGQAGRSSFFIAAGKSLYEAYMPSPEKGLVLRKMLDNFMDTCGINVIINRNDEYLIMGSVYKGIYIYAKNYISTFTAPKNVSNNYFYAQALLPDGNTRLTGGRVLFDSNGYKGIINEPPQNEHQNIENSAYLADSKGFHWFFSYVGEKLCLYKGRFPKDPRAVLIAEDFGDAYGMYEDRQGNIWVQQKGVLGYFEKGSTAYVKVMPGAIDAGFGNLLSMAEDDEGNLYFGATMGIFTLKKGELHKAPRLLCLKGYMIFYLQPGKNGRIWAGTDQGLCVFDSTGSFRFLPRDQKHKADVIAAMVTDSRNRAWISTSGGVYVVPVQALDDFAQNAVAIPFLYRLSERDGFPPEGLTAGSQYTMLLSADGMLSLSTGAGLAWANTNALPGLFSHNPFFLERIKDSLITACSNNETLHFDHSQNRNISFTVSYADWNAPENIETGYLFGNVDDADEAQWQQLPADNKISIPYLATGEYFLTVRKRTGFGTGNYSYISVTITIAPRWFETIWFHMLLVITALLLLGFIIFTRQRMLQRANRLLNIRINEATATLAEKNLELAAYNETKNKLLSLFSHDISVPLFYINQALGQLIANKAFYKAPPEFTQTITAVEHTTSDLNVLMDDILYWIKIQQGNVNLQVMQQPVNVKDTINKVLRLFHLRTAGQHIAITTEADEAFTIVTDERLFTSILYNVLSNAIKFARTGFLNIRLAKDTADKDRFALIVENSVNRAGNGAALQDALHSSNKQGHGIQSRGIGLTLVEDFADRLGFTVQYNFGEGDTFILVIKGRINNTLP